MRKSPIKKVSPKQAKRERDLQKIKPPADGLCQKCGKPPDWRGLARHHNIRRSDCGTNDRENIKFLCGRCHSLEHGIVEK